MRGQAKAQTQHVMNPDKIWTRDFVLICLANFFVVLGFQMTLPTIPIFVKELGGSDQLIGLIVGAFTFSALLFRPYAGKALETKGRQIVYLFGLSVFVVSVGSYAFITSIAVLLFMRVVQGIGFGFSSTATGTIATDLIPPSRRGEGMGYFGVSGNIAMALGPALGLSLVGKISFTYLFLICAVCGIIALLLALKIRYKKVEESPHKTINIKFDFFEKTAIKPSVLLLFITFTFGGIASFLPLYAAQKDVAGMEFYFLVYALFVIVSRTFSGRIYDTKGHQYVFPPGVIMILMAMLLLAWLPNTFVLIFAAAIYGLGFGSVQPALQAWAVSAAPNNRKGMANATFFASFDFGVGIGAMIFGVLASSFGYKVIYLTAAGSVFISLMYYVYILWTERKNSSLMRG